MENFIIMYHGIVVPGRGIETMIQLLEVNQMVQGVILGDGAAEYLSNLRARAAKTGVNRRLIFHSAVNNNELWKYIGASDVGLILFPSTYPSLFYSLPNKFFENIQGETPIICPRYPAMQEIVESYGVGLCCDPDNLNDINECVEKLRTDKGLYYEIKKNIKIAKEELCWEKERVKLYERYKKLISG